MDSKRFLIICNIIICGNKQDYIKSRSNLYLNLAPSIVARHRKPCVQIEVGVILTCRDITHMVRIKIMKRILKAKRFKP